MDTHIQTLKRKLPLQESDLLLHYCQMYSHMNSRIYRQMNRYVCSIVQSNVSIDICSIVQSSVPLDVCLIVQSNVPLIVVLFFDWVLHNLRSNEEYSFDLTIFDTTLFSALRQQQQQQPQWHKSEKDFSFQLFVSGVQSVHHPSLVTLLWRWKLNPICAETGQPIFDKNNKDFLQPVPS